MKENQILKVNDEEGKFLTLSNEKQMKKQIRVGLYDLILSIQNANFRKDKMLYEKLKNILNDKIDIQIDEEYFDYIIKNYTE